MEKNDAYIIKSVNKLYDKEIDYTLSDYLKNRIIIKIFLEFTPKEITSMTPKPCTSYGKFLFDKTNEKLTWEDFTYIRKEEMPLLQYTNQEYYLDNYCEELINKKLIEIVGGLQMKLDEEIMKIHGIMNIISESKINNVNKFVLDRFFDKINIDSGDSYYNYEWVNENNELIFSRNYWGMLWIEDCNSYNDLKTISKIISVPMSEFETIIINYLNDKYKDEFKDRPLQKINNEYCDDSF